MRWEGSVVRAVGWGTSGEVCWRPGQPWDERHTASRIRIEPRDRRGAMMGSEAPIDDDDAPHDAHPPSVPPSGVEPEGR